MMKLIFTCILLFLFLGCLHPEDSKDIHSNAPDEIVDSTNSAATMQRQENIIDEHFRQGALQYPLYSQERQREIDKGLAKDPTIAYLWQQKAMPLFKQGKYEAGMQYLDKAVTYDRRRYLNYRAFMKCIFSKTYREAIVDFENYKEDFGYGFVMDHSYDFHIALCYLQLNEFKKAEETFKADYDYTVSTKGEDWLHHLDLFYYGVTKYELNKNEEAIELFDLALERYPQFSEVLLYKAVCLGKLGRPEEARESYELAELYGKKGFSITEDNAIYERYPYQKRWQ